MICSHARFFKVLRSSLVVLAIFIALPVPGNTTTVTTTNNSGPGSLRDAIDNAASGDTINFSLAYPATITLSNSLVIATNLTISGPGASSLFVNGNHSVGVFAINADETVTISGLTIENGNNSGINNQGTLSVINSVISGNTAENGGGISNVGTVDLTNTTISGNSASSAGGIFNWNGGTVTVTGSTISANAAGSWGGGISSWGTLIITNSTFSGNTAGNGGGIFNYAGTTTVMNSTFSGNSASIGGGGGFWNQSVTTLKNTILANSPSGGNCGGYGGTSAGHNISDDNSCLLLFSQSGDLNNVPAGLDSAGLQNNGGLTQTIALLVSSPAIDAIPLSPTNYCTAADGTTAIAADQRGVARSQGSGCDSGSVEVIKGRYKVCLLYDATKAAKSGRTIPIKLQLCDGNGQDLSSAAITAHAVSVTQASSSISGSVQDSGNANPDFDFRYDSALGSTGGYIFNFSTKGMTLGSYDLNFNVTGDTFIYSAPFQVN